METTARRQYFSPWQILVGTLLGGPMAGGYLIASDHNAFGAADRGRAALLVSCLVVAAGVVLGHELGNQVDPADGSLVAGVIAGSYGVYARRVFTAEIARRSGAGWVRHSWGRVVGISLAILIAMLSLMALAMAGLGMGR